jgi:hypothetical protein
MSTFSKKEIESLLLDLQQRISKLEFKPMPTDQFEAVMYKIKWLEEALKPRLRRRVERHRRKYLDKLEFAAAIVEARIQKEQHDGSKR